MSGTVAILQARMSSSRLPGKVLAEVRGRPMIAQQIDRLRRAETLDRLVVATSTDASDDPLAALCEDMGIDVHRGSLTDVLDRYYQAAKRWRADTVVRLTGDCPLVDPAVIDALVTFYHDGGYDYASNAVTRTFPKGLDAEVFSFAALEAAWTEAVLPSHREHVTRFFYLNEDKSRFRMGFMTQECDLSALRWTVDYPEDLEFVRRVYDALYPVDPAFAMDAILDLMARQPELARLNAHIDAAETERACQAQDSAYLTGAKGAD